MPTVIRPKVRFVPAAPVESMTVEQHAFLLAWQAALIRGEPGMAAAAYAQNAVESLLLQREEPRRHDPR